MQPWFTVYFFNIGHPCDDQLTPIKIRYPLTSITWPYSGLKFTAHWGQEFFLSWPLTKCWFFDWIACSLLKKKCLKQDKIVRKPVYANPGLKVNRIKTFCSLQMPLLFNFVYMVIIETQNKRPNNIQETYKVTKPKLKFFFFLRLLNGAVNNPAQELRF